jgi:thioredoxin reductase (NADPH)
MHDLIIIGAGPAGLNASIYASRYGVNNLVIGGIAGGLTTNTHEIGNWLGEEKISGFEFAQKAVGHAKSLGADVKLLSVDQINKLKDETFDLLLSDGSNIQCRSILIATGSKHRKLGVDREQEMIGRGVSYCATCDGFFYKGKTVGIIGGGDSAVYAAVFMSNIAEKVYLIYRGEKLRAESFWVDTVKRTENIEVIYNTNVKEFLGEDTLTSVMLDIPFEKSNELAIEGLFIEIGFTPCIALIKDLGVDVDEESYIKIEGDGRTSAKGIWAAGDITTGSEKFKQIVTAAAEGALAAYSIQKYLKR